MPRDTPGVAPLVIAHRLGRAYGPDHSARALAGALGAGVDGLEADVCLSADGRLLLLQLDVKAHADAALAALRGHGLSVTTGTVNDPALLKRVLRFRPDAVTTDAPHALRGVLSSPAA